jgi:hypothetical protein
MKRFDAIKQGRKIPSARGLFTPCMLASSLLEAMAEAARNATSGDVILLSPACSGFDQFRKISVSKPKNLWGGEINMLGCCGAKPQYARCFGARLRIDSCRSIKFKNLLRDFFEEKPRGKTPK